MYITCISSFPYVAQRDPPQASLKREQPRQGEICADLGYQGVSVFKSAEFKGLGHRGFRIFRGYVGNIQGHLGMLRIDIRQHIRLLEIQLYTILTNAGFRVSKAISVFLLGGSYRKGCSK